MVPLFYLTMLYCYLQTVSQAGGSQHHVTVIAAEGEDITLHVNSPGAQDISWIFGNNHFATTRPDNQISVRSLRLRGRLLSMANGSLKLTGVTKEDQGVYTANVYMEDDHWQYNVKVYPKLSIDDLHIDANVTRNRSCGVTLTCTVNASDVTIFWNHLNDSIIDRGSLLHLYKVRPETDCTCTAENPVSRASKRLTPWTYCQEGHIGQQQTGGSSGAGLLLGIIAVIILSITVLVLLIRRRKKIKQALERTPQIFTICHQEIPRKTGSSEGQNIYAAIIKHI